MFQMRAKMISVGLLGAASLFPVNFAKADQLGHASWYSLPANTTANGERMDPNELTAAHRSLPFGTRVLVENLANGRSVVVRINDRGPFIGGRIIDLSKAAAASIGMIEAGTAKVRVTTADGGSAIAALGESTVKAKSGASAAVSGKADVAPADAAPKVTAVADKPAKTRTVAAKASAGGKRVAKTLGAEAKTQVARKLEADAKIQVASVTKRELWRQSRFAASQDGIRAAAYQASDLPKPRFAWSSDRYAKLEAAVDVKRPRTRRFG
jgi:rare lipoprotein A